MNKTDFEKLVGRCKFPGYEFNVVEENGVCHVQVTYLEPDVMTGVTETQRGRMWRLEKNSEPIQVVQTAFKALLTSLEHRARENFTVDDFAVLEPHHDLDVLLEIAARRFHAANPIPIVREVTLGATVGDSEKLGIINR